VSAGRDELESLAAYREQMREAFGPLYPMLAMTAQQLLRETQRLNGWCIDPRQAALAVACTLPDRHAAGKVLLMAAALEAIEQQAAAQAEYACAKARGRAPAGIATAAPPPRELFRITATGDCHAPVPSPAFPHLAPAAPAAAAPAPAALAPALQAPLPGAGHRGAGRGAAVPAAPAGGVAAAPAAAAAAAGRAAGARARAAWRALTAAHGEAWAVCWNGIGMCACVGLVLGAGPAVAWLTDLAVRWLA
jgi:hypothetical protein